MYPSTRLPVYPSNGLNRPPDQPRDEPESERDVAPAILTFGTLVERELHPDVGPRRLRLRAATMRMPHIVPIPVIQKTLEQAHPSVVLPKEPETSHQFQPGQREWDIEVGDVPARQWIA